jgi:hypothetical protein
MSIMPALVEGNTPMSRKGVPVIRIFVTAILAVIVRAPMRAQCGIQPIKPIPPIGCSDVTPQCIADGMGNSHWNWVCVLRGSGGNSSFILGFESATRHGTNPSGENQSTSQPSMNNTIKTSNSDIGVAQLASGVQLGEMDDGEKRATADLRAIAEMIKLCSVPNIPLGERMQAEGFVDGFGPPENVVWNVEAHPSTRARYTGTIEFSQPSYIKPPSDDSYCDQPHIDKKECRRMWAIGTQLYHQDRDHPLQFRYEFDASSQGLEFLRAFQKTKQTGDEPWIPAEINANGCASRAINTQLNDLSHKTRSDDSAITASTRVLKHSEESGNASDSATVNQGPSGISGVGIGMPRDLVLRGLSGRYALTKVDLPSELSQFELWVVVGKTISNAGSWKIAFKDGRVVSVTTKLD